VSGTEEDGTMEIDESELYDDWAAARLERDRRSSNKQWPSPWTKSRQSVP